MAKNEDPNMMRLLESMEKHGQKEAGEVFSKENPIEESSGDTWKFYEDTEAGRICFEFDGKPEQEIIDTLKSNGFKWSPKNTRWQRQTTDNARRAADRIKETLTA